MAGNNEFFAEDYFSQDYFSDYFWPKYVVPPDTGRVVISIDATDPGISLLSAISEINIDGVEPEINITVE